MAVNFLVRLLELGSASVFSTLQSLLDAPARLL